MTHVIEPLDPRHGIAEPTSSTPPRRPGSIRRTSTVDSTYPGGWAIAGPVGSRRDVYTGRDGAAELVADTTMTVTTAYTDGPIVGSIVLDPPSRSTDALVGVRASTGFRKAIDDTTDVARGRSRTCCSTTCRARRWCRASRSWWRWIATGR